MLLVILLLALAVIVYLVVDSRDDGKINLSAFRDVFQAPKKVKELTDKVDSLEQRIAKLEAASTPKKPTAPKPPTTPKP